MSLCGVWLCAHVYTTVYTVYHTFPHCLRGWTKMPRSKEEQARNSLYIQREHRTAPLFVVVDLEGKLARRRDKKNGCKGKRKIWVHLPNLLLGKKWAGKLLLSTYC